DGNQKAQHEQTGEPIGDPGGPGVPTIQNGTDHPKFSHLHTKFIPINPSFMVHKGPGKQSGIKTGLPNPKGEVRILPWVDPTKTPDLLKGFPGNSHIETARLKFPHRFPPSPNPPGGKKGGHHIVYGLLDPAKGGIGGIRSAKTMHKLPSEFPVNLPEIMRGEDAIRIQNDKIVSLGPFHAVVPGIPGTGILLVVIGNVEAVFKALGDFPRILPGTVLDDHHLKILLEILLRKAFQQFPNFLGPVVHGDHYGEVYVHSITGKRSCAWESSLLWNWPPWVVRGRQPPKGDCPHTAHPLFAELIDHLLAHPGIGEPTIVIEVLHGHLSGEIREQANGVIGTIVRRGVA